MTLTSATGGGKPKVKELGFELNSQEYIIWAYGLTLQEAGQVWLDIQSACRSNDADFLEQFPFVGRIYVGRMRGSRPSIPAAVRRAVLSAGACLFCGCTEQLTIDHIRPYSKGGTHDLANLQCLCWLCNRAKSNKWEVSR